MEDMSSIRSANGYSMNNSSCGDLPALERILPKLEDQKIEHPLPYGVKVSPPDHLTTMTTHGDDVLACYSEDRANRGLSIMDSLS
ncbi:hypothetical protein RCL_jg1423.t1 [Rhizophagus clarus]|uniref:Uncharacterized protein n=1 Tax=Rhizophagus clarus TaxID=94130 RepID=A0A8H3LQJ1_9GLOM|nr:hypothetical protein RCL_jg1423.t1 [Rhizophagus clarus]